MTIPPPARTALRYLLTVGMVSVGVMHFTNPAFFEAIVPPMLGDARLLVSVSGVFEVLGGLGLILPQTRRAAAWGLILLFIAVFPANIYMAVEGIQPDPNVTVEPWMAWARLPFQFVFIAWAYLFTRPEPRTAPVAVEAG